MYAKTLYAGWGDMDFNSHMKNTAYLDKAADVLQMFLMAHGFPIDECLRLRIGPVVMKNEIEYYREVGRQAERTGHQRGRMARLGRTKADGPTTEAPVRHELTRANQ